MRLRQLPGALAGRLDGLAMTGLACFMGWLVLWGDYWLYLNPKFKPVTLAAAVLLAVLGAYATLRPVSRPSLGRALCYLALGAMIALNEGGTQAISQTTDNDPFLACPVLPPAGDSRPTVPLRLTAGGKDYIPINTGELYDLAAKGHGQAWDKPYALRGFVHRSADLDAKGEFVLFRLAVWCCFADSTAVGFRVTLPPGASLPPNAGWLIVYGRLTDAPEAERQEYVLPGMPFSSIAPAALLAADQLEAATPAPEETPMFEWHQEEPYAY